MGFVLISEALSSINIQRNKCMKGKIPKRNWKHKFNDRNYKSADKRLQKQWNKNQIYCLKKVIA